MTISPTEARELALKRLQSREPLTGEYPIRLESGPVERLALAQVALDEAEATEYGTDDDRAAAIEGARSELTAAQEQVDGSTVVFTFEGLPPAEFDALVDRHPPTEEETAQAETRGLRSPQYSQALRPVLVAATCTFPGFTSPEEAEGFLWGGKARLSLSEANDMFEIAWAVCTGRREVVDWGKDFARTRG